MAKRKPPAHVHSLLVMSCSHPSCQATENGCNQSYCKGDMSWTRMYHDDFVERFGRCPTSCRAAFFRSDHAEHS